MEQQQTLWQHEQVEVDQHWNVDVLWVFSVRIEDIRHCPPILVDNLPFETEEKQFFKFRIFVYSLQHPIYDYIK